ncbi:pilus assembly protein PilM [candidate division NPL-UPA2 bacterium]|nr:pilus assembly protein PilM [candidate division NPL-UPA2 bacterium]
MIKNSLLRLYRKGKERLTRELRGITEESLGLDIGTRFIKLVAVDYSSGEPLLKWAGLREISAPGEDGVIGLIADLRKEGCQEINTKEVVINLGSPPTVQRLEFPSALSDEEAKEAALLEVSQLIPNLEGMESEVKIFRPEGAEKVSVLFVSAPREAVARRVGLVERAGLSPRCMDIDSLALLNGVIQLGEMKRKESLLILNIGTSFINLALVKEGGSPFLRDIPQGSRELLPPSGDSSSPVKGIEVLTQIERSLEYYQTRDKIKKIDRILLGGGAGEIPTVYEYFQENMPALPEKWNPLLKIGHYREAASLRQLAEKEGGHFSVALGLALRSEVYC